LFHDVPIVVGSRTVRGLEEVISGRFFPHIVQCFLKKTHRAMYRGHRSICVHCLRKNKNSLADLKRTRTAEPNTGSDSDRKIQKGPIFQLDLVIVIAPQVDSQPSAS
jgi:hypothetical protein